MKAWRASNLPAADLCLLEACLLLTSLTYCHIALLVCRPICWPNWHPNQLTSYFYFFLQVRDALYTAIRLPLFDRCIRHEKHWKYVSNHTVQFWAKVRVACGWAGVKPAEGDTIGDAGLGAGFASEVLM